MRLALICMDGAVRASKAKPADTSCWPSVFEDFQQLEVASTLTIDSYLREQGRLEPLLICLKGSQLEKSAQIRSIPFISIASTLSPIHLFGLWRWQRKQPWLPILLVGAAGLHLARRLAVMRKTNRGQLNCAFLLEPPPIAKARELVPAAHVLCGSTYIEEKLGNLLQNNFPKDQQPPQLLKCLPGINITDYDFPSPAYDDEKDVQKGRHFVFGMAGSLLANSGALLVARAMAAIWQRSDLPPWEMRMFGSGPRFDEILREAKLLGVDSRLSILSDQPLPDVSRLCHAWIAPCTGEMELPQNLWAGFAAGLPVICVQSRLHKERLQFAEHSAVLRVGEDNPQELARAMIGVMRNGRLRQRLAAAGRNLAPRLGLEAMAQRVCEHLEDWLPTSNDVAQQNNPEKGLGE